MSETTSWRRLCFQNPSHAYLTPSKLSAILCVLLGNLLRAVFAKIEIFSGTTKFSSLYAGASRVPFWPSGPNPFGGKKFTDSGLYHERFCAPQQFCVLQSLKTNIFNPVTS